tara:strand:- start:10278 stop:11258 length:981 start_codon:yes stop_codon:yes gene_type:complete
MLDLDQIKKDFDHQLAECNKAFDVHQVKSVFLGKKSDISHALKQIPSLPEEQRRDFATQVNKIKQSLLSSIDQRLADLEAEVVAKEIKHTQIDVTIPIESRVGSLHPVQSAIFEIVDIMKSMGFSYRENAEIETLFNNFTGLNIPENHPARLEQDTFYTDDGRLLRTHTSSVQVHVLRDEQPPLKIVCPGRVFRNDHDRTHSPMFHQLECLYINKQVNMQMLLATIKELLARFFKKDIPIRLRPNYFPFTEPSAEVDIQFEGKWLEVLGCGMVHPDVLSMANIDTNIYRGYAFGVGIDRLIMLRHGITDLRDLFINHHGFLEQFSG